MPSWRRTKPAPPAATQAIIATAVMIDQRSLRAIPSPKGWQASAWEYYDRIGELRFAAGWLANAASRCRLYVGTPAADGAGDPDPVDDPRITQPLDELDGGQAANLLTRIALHLTVAGESYLVGYDDPATNQRRWIAASGSEFTGRTGKRMSVKLPDADAEFPLQPDKSTVIRIWRPHPVRAWEADSPTRGVLEPLQEIINLAAHTKASVDSRLAGAGILVIPESATLPAARADDTSHVNNLHEDPFVSTLIHTMVTAIGNRDDASAVVPIVMRVRDDAIDKFRHITFSTPLDAQIQAMQESAIRRLALGLDIPPEIVLGQGDTNHWTSWWISEDAIKIHVEPLVALICQALTERYLRPSLAALGVPNPDQYVVWFDPADLVLRPNRTPEAIQLREIGAVASRVTLREAGFGEDDAPSDAEYAEWLLAKLALAGVDPATVSPYLTALGIDIAAPDSSTEPGATGNPAPAVTPAPSRPEIPTTPGSPNNPALPASAAPAELGWMFAALEGAVIHALDHAGKRLLRRGNRSHRGSIDAPTYELHTAVRTDRADLDSVLKGAYLLLDISFGDQPCIRETVDQYVRALIAAGAPHESRYLAAALQRAGCLTPPTPELVA